MAAWYVGCRLARWSRRWRLGTWGVGWHAGRAGGGLVRGEPFVCDGVWRGNSAPRTIGLGGAVAPRASGRNHFPPPRHLRLLQHTESTPLALRYAFSLVNPLSGAYRGVDRYATLVIMTRGGKRGGFVIRASGLKVVPLRSHCRRQVVMISVETDGYGSFIYHVDDTYTGDDHLFDDASTLLASFCYTRWSDLAQEVASYTPSCRPFLTYTLGATDEGGIFGVSLIYHKAVASFPHGVTAQHSLDRSYMVYSMLGYTHPDFSLFLCEYLRYAVGVVLYE